MSTFTKDTDKRNFLLEGGILTGGAAAKTHWKFVRTIHQNSRTSQMDQPAYTGSCSDLTYYSDLGEIPDSGGIQQQHVCIRWGFAATFITQRFGWRFIKVLDKISSSGRINPDHHKRTPGRRSFSWKTPHGEYRRYQNSETLNAFHGIAVSVSSCYQKRKGLFRV